MKTDRLDRLRRERAEAEEKLSAAQLAWARAADEGNSPQKEALNVLIAEAKDVIRTADFNIRALELHQDSA